jgi:multiple antibiotic resistance protein
MGIALGVLCLFLFFGRFILEGMQISQAALSMAGGVILFLIALRMIFPATASGDEERYEEEPLIVPLAIPFIAGPSALALVTLLATQSPERIWVWFGALTTAWAASTVILLTGEALRRLMGERVIRAVVRLMGMILTTLAIQMLLTGVRAFVKSLPSR